MSSKLPPFSARAMTRSSGQVSRGPVTGFMCLLLHGCGLARLPRCPAGLDLVWIFAVAGSEELVEHVQGPVLHLPDVAELVRQEIVRCALSGWPAEQNRAPERIAVVAAEPWQLEERRQGPDTHAVEANGP